MKSSVFFAVLFTGMTLGGLVGILTRPSYLGFQVPLSLLVSSSPMDAPFRQELASHLAMAVGIGGILTGLLLFFVTFISNSFGRRS